MKNFCDKLWELIPAVWGLLWLVIITVGSVSLLIWVFQWLFKLLGVM